MESAWTLNETCRFRIQTPEQYDNSTDEKPSPSERKVSFNCKYCGKPKYIFILPLFWIFPYIPTQKCFKNLYKLKGNIGNL